MAKRPVFIPVRQGSSFVEQKIVEFQWFPGFSRQQKQRSIRSLHAAAEDRYALSPLLEISSKSPLQVGIELSAFHLILDDPALEQPTSVEAAFQGSKVFSDGGPFTDLYSRSPREAKRDPRLKESGSLEYFEFAGKRWDLIPRTAFYDWLYLCALQQHPELAQQLLGYSGYSDIEFNPQRSINCQAGSAALYAALVARGLLDEAMQTPETYLRTIAKAPGEGPTQFQPPLFNLDRNG